MDAIGLILGFLVGIVDALINRWLLVGLACALESNDVGGLERRWDLRIAICFKSLLSGSYPDLGHRLLGFRYTEIHSCINILIFAGL